jgi:hypothetical protein
MVNRLDAANPSAGQNGNSLALSAFLENGELNNEKEHCHRHDRNRGALHWPASSERKPARNAPYLKVAIESRYVDAPAPVCQFYTDDVLTGPLLARCWSRAADDLPNSCSSHA